MNKNLLFGAGAVIVAILGYMLFSNMNKQAPAPVVETPTTTENSASPSATTNEIMVTLLEQNTSGESGTATLMEVDGRVVVTIKTTGGAKDISQPAHIHVGVCPEVGAVKYPLTNLLNGMSETTLDITLADLKAQLPLGINVHKSVPDAKVYVSCGDLKL